MPRGVRTAAPGPVSAPRVPDEAERRHPLAEKGIFRQAALDRLASSEQLDALLGLAPPRARLVLFAGAALALAAGLWWLLDVAVAAPAIFR